MRKFGFFLFNLLIKCAREQILERAAGLTLRVLLAFFPFLVFLMALMGFLDLDTEAIFGGLYEVLPAEISELVAGFVEELSATRSAGLLSAALFFSVYNTTNGFRAIIRVTNAAYGIEERRGFFAQVFLSFGLMLLFSAALIVMLAFLVFGQQTWQSGLAALFLLFLFTAYIYKLACAKPLPKRHILPGAAFTVILWVGASAAFGIFTRHFSQFPAIYGSIAGVFLLILWLNAVSVILLIGNEINAMLHEYSEK